MPEPETEMETLDRLEAALARIAAEAAGPPSPDRNGDHARADIAAALDRIIAQLRDALAAADQPEQT